MLLKSDNKKLKSKYTVRNKMRDKSIYCDVEKYIKLYTNDWYFPNGAKIFMEKWTWQYNKIQCSKNFSVNENFILKDYQIDAINFIKKRNCGLIQAPTGAGKSFITIWLINNYKCSTLIVTPTKKLLNEMKDRIVEYTNYIPWIYCWEEKNIKHITIATTTSFVKDIHNLSWFNMVIIDECDTKISTNFIYAICHCNCEILVWMTWTPKRQDLNRNDLELIYWPHKKFWEYQVLPNKIIQHEYQRSTKELYNFWREFRMENNLYLTRRAYQFNTYRRNKIFQLIEILKEKSFLTLILVDTKEEVEKISEHFRTALVITWDTKIVDDEIWIRRLKKYWWIIIWTRQKIWRWVDIPQIDNVVVASPVKFESTVIQAIWRALRHCEWKKPVEINIINDNSWVFRNQGDEQAKVCEKEYEISPEKKILYSDIKDKYLWED